MAMYLSNSSSMASPLLLLFSLTLQLMSSNLCCALNVLVVGGTGRVGGSTVRWLQTLSDRNAKPPEAISITVGGRRREAYETARQRNVIPARGVDFLPMDIDGDTKALRQTLRQWKTSRATNDCLVVHTGKGPALSHFVGIMSSSSIHR